MGILGFMPIVVDFLGVLASREIIGLITVGRGLLVNAAMGDAIFSSWAFVLLNYQAVSRQYHEIELNCKGSTTVAS